MANTKTLQDMRDIYYGILKEDQDTSAYPYVLADTFFNSLQWDICSWVVTDLTSWNLDQIEKAALPFLFEDKYYTSVQDTYVWDDTLIVWWDTITTSSTTDFLSAWFLWINEDIVKYTWKTDTSFTWVTGIDFAHEPWARISQLFEVPDDFATWIRAIYNNQITLRWRDYRDLYLRLNDYKWGYWSNNIVNANNTTIDRFAQNIEPFYTIVQWKYFLPFQLDVSWNMIHFIYEKEPEQMTEVTDLTTIPDKYASVTIPILAAADTLYNRWEEDRWLKLHRFGLGKIMAMYSYYSNQNNEDLNWQRVETWKDMILNI